MDIIQPFMFMMMSSNSTTRNITFTIFMILLSYMAKVIPYGYISYEIENLLNKRNDVHVQISSHEIPLMRAHGSIPFTKLVYSKTFLSIIHYVKTHTNIHFETSTEVMISNSELTNLLYTDHVEEDKYIMMPINNTKTLITTDIYFELKSQYKERGGGEDEKNKNSNIISRSFIIILSTTNGNKIDIIHHFIEKCISEYDELLNIKLKDKRQYIFEYKGSEKEEGAIRLNYNEHLMEHNKDLTTNIFFEQKEKLIQYITPFVYNENDKGNNDGEDKYKRSGFTFKAGLLFYGSPGCGKTSTIKAILKYTNRHAVIINLSRIKTCEELERIFRNRIIKQRNLVGKQICFILEDCDAFEDSFVRTRETTPNSTSTKKPTQNYVEVDYPSGKSTFATIKDDDDDKINLSCFLNILDGIIEMYGVMIIMTTNYPDKIDPALIRPGRFDFKYEFKKASRQIVLEMISFKYELSEKEIDQCRELLKELKDGTFSPAEIQSICFKSENMIDAINQLR